MHIKLPEQLETYLQTQVNLGLYSSTSEFVRELIRKRMEEDGKRHNQAFYNYLRAGDEAAARGGALPLTGENWKAPLRKLCGAWKTDDDAERRMQEIRSDFDR